MDIKEKERAIIKERLLLIRKIGDRIMDDTHQINKKRKKMKKKLGVKFD